MYHVWRFRVVPNTYGLVMSNDGLGVARTIGQALRGEDLTVSG